ncbi:hypothetical protein [Halomonas llamarensis]|uniref:Outer membrane protein beta-barrel domain-containing protein n=1 Tax=Halomonas llamarensis TaxID=2945104 RepID=A0ABT0STX8_9GAMM|nr:hypothetical protein [Halomonas llamarensis]MCL7931186.1 hypothetical protein [Halomonas llamarensis]
MKISQLPLALTWALSLGIATLGYASQATAADDAWRFQLTPYVWMAGLSGDIRPQAGAPPVRATRTFGDVLDDVDGALFLTGSARRDRWVLFGDLTWASLSHEGVLAPGVTVEGKLRQRSFTAAAGYQVVSQPDHHLDLLAGARAWRIEAEVAVPALGVGASKTERWVDPILAARLRSRLTSEWSTILHADIGGFGVGADSTLQLVATANYAVSEAFHLSAGYRHLAVDRDEAGSRLDVSMNGPLLGVTWRF